MKHCYSILLFFLVQCSFLSAQSSYVHQVIFLNEGWYDFFNDTLVIPPSVGTYDPVSDSYHVFDVIPEADFATEVIVDEVIYVAADNYVITYDKNTLSRLSSKNIPGVRGMAIWNDQLLVSRGDYLLTFDSYFQVYDKNTLEFLYELNTSNGPAYASESIIVHNDTAYLAINNGFIFGEEVGIIGIIDLQNRVYAGEIDLGPEGINPDNLMLDGNHVYSLNNKDYTSSSVSAIDAATREVATHDNIAANSGCGTSALANEHIYYMEYGVDKLARFNIKDAKIVDTLEGTAAYYGLVDDKINGRLFATWTDFFSTGIAYVLDYQGNVLNTFDVGVSAGSIALDVRSTTSTLDPNDTEINFFPNPVTTFLEVASEKEIKSIHIYNYLGQPVFTSQAPSNRVDMRSAAAGMYTIDVKFEDGDHYTHRILKN
jgi:hypothetical protein